MEGNKKVISLGLDYSSFDGGITDVNRKMGLLDAQFKLSKEEIKEYGEETDQLTLKQEQLTQKINLQTQKVNLSKEAYDKAVEGGKASDKQLDNLQKAYITNQTTLQKLNNELVDNKEKIDNASKSSESFGDSIRGMASSLGLEVSPALEMVASKFDGVSKEMGTAIIGIGAIITTFAKASIETADFADNLMTLSDITGITTTELQKMQYASGLLDVEVETITGSITKLTRNMDSARDGSKNQADAFKQVGVRYKEANGELRNSNEVFYELIDALGKVKNETEREAIAMALMGKSAKDLNPLIQQGSERLRELGVEAENLGVIMSDESLAKAGALQDSLDRFNEVSAALKNSLGVELLPVLTNFIGALSSIPVPVLKTLVVLASTIATLVMVGKAVKSITDTTKAFKGFFTAANPAALKTTAIIIGVVAALIALAVAIAVITGKGKDLQNSMNSVGSAVGNVTTSVNNAQSSVRSAGYNASGTKDFIGGKTWVGEGGPEIVELPKGSKIYNNRESQKMGSKGDTYYITIDAKNVTDFNRVVKLAEEQKSARIRGEVPI